MASVSTGLLDRLMNDEDKSFYKTLGQRVAMLRKQNHLTQVQMAAVLGVSQQQIAAFEAGRVKVPVSMLPKLSELLSTPIDEIVGVKKKQRRGPASMIQQRVDMLGQLPRSKQKFVIEMLDTLIMQSKQAG